jgi:tetratricopeptide (TPR) repeat protein
LTHNILRLSQVSSSQGKCQVRIEFLKEWEVIQTAFASFDFDLSQQDQERLRWYFEDYLLYPQDPAPTIACQVEGLLTQIGTELFDKIFKSNSDAHKIWSYVHLILKEIRVEIVTDIQETTSIPWELICNPDTLQPLALSTASFMRTFSQAAISPKFKFSPEGPIRILLAICRPGADDDVPFRSVASQVIRGLSAAASSCFQLDVLRPPTFAQLERVLKAAKEQTKPYHVLHFDGHGIYTGNRGWICFEYPDPDEDGELVNGNRLGKLMQEYDVPILVLNACRSAYSESPSEPASAQDAEQIDAHKRVRAFGSLAQEVMHSGAAGVVAMRYVVYVVTAALFVAELYGALAQGRTLEEAVNLGRKHLHDQPWREIAPREHKLQDWSVPMVYGDGTLALFPQKEGETKSEIKTSENGTIYDVGKLDSNLIPGPDKCFFGRDETLLATDRAFDTHKVVLLHAYAGSGKTAAAAEFARWYSLTGGVNGPVLFTSFERYLPLPRVLDKIGQVFGKTLEYQGIHWLTLDDDQRRHAALQVLKQKPVFWIWDNVEPMAGFPIGTESAWSIQEQQDLVNFLRDARDTQAKFLLTSRREERELLGDLPRRVSVPPMPMFERTELALSIAEKKGNRMVDVEYWKPLLRYTDGNPLTITVLVGQALRENLSTKDQIEQFVDQLRSGEKDIEDDESQGRSRSLGVSLRYGSQNAFDEKERRVLALLSFFQGFVYVDALMLMGQGSFSFEELLGLRREDGLKLLDRAAEVGMLTILGRGYYRIHPALPWFFRGLFQQYHKGREDEATRAFVEALGTLGDYYLYQYEAGNREAVSVLAAEEANLLYALRMALRRGWWGATIGTMQGLVSLYDHAGWWIEWMRLVEEILPFFVDLKTDNSLPNLEEEWGIITGYRLWDGALRLATKRMEWDRKRAGPSLDMNPHDLDGDYRNKIRNYIISLGDLAEIQMKRGERICIRSYVETIEICEKYGFLIEASSYSRNLGNVYRNLSEVWNLDQAELWYKHGLDTADDLDNLERGRCLISLGHVASERFLETIMVGRADEKHFEAAEDFYLQALEAFPLNVANELAATHNALGVVYANAGKFEEALGYYQKAISHIDTIGDFSRAARFRFNVAINLANTGRIPEALKYARYALEKFEACGQDAAKDVQETQDLIDKLEEP